MIAGALDCFPPQGHSAAAISGATRASPLTHASRSCWANRKTGAWARANNWRALLLDTQLLVLRLLDGQCRPVLQVGRAFGVSGKPGIPASAAALLVRVGRVGTTHIGRRRVDRTVNVKHQPTGAACLLDDPAREAGMGGVFPLRQTFLAVARRA